MEAYGRADMTTPLLQEAAKVLQDAYSEWMTQHGHATPWEQFCAAVLFRWLLTREPTEGMLKDGRDTLVTREQEFHTVPEYVSGIYRAMNAALLKEVEG